VEDSKGNTQLLRVIAKENLDTLAEAFFTHFQTKFLVVSAYRSYEYQK
jgi:LAS superfamily LD-carboxypeptidase LdcB